MFNNSCSDSDSPNMCGNFEKELEDWEQAVMAFLENPTTANCNVFKNRFLGILDRYENCTVYRNQMQEARREWEQIDCSDIDD